jgi:glyoxylase-like metal-dependent hydrolase (beta-lactamase superfamily II)/predicted ester cyclase
VPSTPATTAEPETTDVAEVGRRYFAAVNDHDVEGALACWHPDGEEVISGETIPLPDGYRAYFTEVFDAVPDLRLEPLDEVIAGDRYILRYRITGTFAGPGRLQGFDPTGSRLSFVGLDMLRIEDGRIRRNDAFVDGMKMAEGLGVLPPQDSPQAQRMASLVNRRTRLRSLAVAPPERVADGVWVVRGGLPTKTMNVYLIEEDGGVALFDAGIRAMTDGLAALCARRGGITRIILGHGHADHRGAAAGLGAPVYCHPAEVEVATGDGGESTFDFSRLSQPTRFLIPRMLRWWDGGPVEIAGTVSEDEEVLGFRVVPTPGHSPGQIALFRESDRLALTTDTFYTLDPETTRKGPPRLPHAAFTPDVEAARASIRRIAELEPAAAWPGHADPVTGDVRRQLEAAAAA